MNIMYVSNVYAQDNTTIPQERPSREKRAEAIHRTGLGLIGVGVLLQIAGILVGIESNRYYIEAYDSHAKWQRTNSVEDATRFNDLSEIYTTFAISSASIFGVGFLITLTGSILVARTHFKVSDAPDTQSAQSVSFAQSFSHVPILSNNVYVFNYGYQLGINIR